jgi:hypothetical protein
LALAINLFPICFLSKPKKSKLYSSVIPLMRLGNASPNEERFRTPSPHFDPLLNASSSLAIMQIRHLMLQFRHHFDFAGFFLLLHLFLHCQLFG